MELGDVLAGRYQLWQCLGTGGMGVVYRAFDKRHDQEVALKTLIQAQPATIYQLKQEFRALAGIAHPNLVELYELFSEQEDWFFTMELIDGVTFQEYVSGSPPEAPQDRRDTVPVGPPTEHTPIGGVPVVSSDYHVNLDRLRNGLKQLAEGVFALHVAGKLHRDIKPSNVLVTHQGRVVLLDMGISSELRQDSFLQSTEQRPMGTPVYMAPEQATQAVQSEASDWYAVGVLLFEALTGQLPFDGEPLHVMFRKTTTDPPQPSDLCDDLPKDLNDLCRRLLAQNPEDRPAGEEVLSLLGVSPRPPTGALPRATPSEDAVFVGREAELAQLLSAFEETRKGRWAAVYVAGRSGVGKTALIRQFLSRLVDREDVVVLAGRCFEQESVPYKALDGMVDALSRFLRQMPRDELDELLPADVYALVRLFPVLARVKAVAEAPWRAGSDSPKELRRRAFDAFRELISRLAAKHHLVIYVDDLQWGDIDSVPLMLELTRPPDSPPVLVLGCYRSEEAEASPFLQAMLAAHAEKGALGAGVELTLDVLSEREAGELAAALTANSDEGLNTERIARESGGNPFFVGEFVRYVRAITAEATNADPVTQPDLSEVTLRQVLSARLDALPDDARLLLEMIALAARPLEEHVALLAAGISTDQKTPLSLLRSGNLIRPSVTGHRRLVETYHDKIREGAVESIPAGTLASRHRALADALATDPDADAESIAVHLRGAGETKRASLYVRRAASRASDALAFDRAAQLYELAISLPTEDEEIRDLRVKMGDALANAGRGGQAADAYLAAVPRASESVALDLRRRAFEQLLGGGYVEKGLEVMDEVCHALGFRIHQSRLGVLTSLATRRAQVRLRGAVFCERHQSKPTAAELARVDTCWAISTRLGLIDTVRGADFQARHLLLAAKAGEPQHYAKALGVEACYAAHKGPRATTRARKLLAAQATFAAELDDPSSVGIATLCAGIVSQQIGQYKEGLRLCDEADNALESFSTGVKWELMTARYFGIDCLFWLGRFRELSLRTRAQIALARDLGDRLQDSQLRTQYMAPSRLADDDIDGAKLEITEGMALWPNTDFHLQHQFELAGIGNIDLYAGNGPQSWQMLEERWKALARSYLLSIHNVKVVMLDLRARSALATAQRGGVQQKSLLRVALRDGRRLKRERAGWSDAMAHLIGAGISAVRGDLDSAVIDLKHAATGFEGADMAMHQAAAERRLGQVLAGDEGAELVRTADERMDAEGIQRPECWTAMLAPGFGECC